MALDINSMLLQPTRLNPNMFDMGDPKAASMERERLQLMREQFENTKLQQQKELEYQKTAEQGRMAREQMQSDRQAAAAQAAAAAERTKVQQAALADFTKLNGAGDVEGARAMVPMLTQLGLEVELLGEENGLPAYRIGPDPEAAQRDAGQIGYPGTDSTPMQEPLGVQSTGDAFARALASQGQPAKPPDAPDYTGAVPKNVIDLGAQHQATLASLNPALKNMVESYPEEYRESAGKTADAVRSLPLGSVKSVELMDRLRGSPDRLIGGQLQAEAARGEQGVKRAEAQGKDAQARYETGFKVLGKETADKYAVDGIIERQKTRSQAAFALDNTTDADDYMAGASIARDMGEKGVLTEGDIKRTLGTAAMSFLDRVSSGAYKEAVGGLAPEQKKALRGLIDQADKEDRKRAMSMLSNMDEVLGDPATDPDVARGMRDYRRLIVPKALRDEYESVKKRKRGGSAAAEPQGFNMEADANAEFGRTVEGQTTIPQSSRIAFEHNNPGNLKFVDQEGATLGEPAQDGGHWAKFATVDEGMEALRQQVLRDAERGLSVREFITKYAPPGSNDTETYIAQALAELKARDGDSLAEIDPYDMVRFIAKKESGTELPDQYTSDEPDPVAARAARIRELQEKARQ